MFGFTKHITEAAPPENLIEWFLSGKRPERKRRKKKAAKWLRKKFGPEGETRFNFVGEDGERIWSIRKLLTEANAALDALDAGEDPKFAKRNDSIYTLQREDWADLRLLGPYICSEETVMRADAKIFTEYKMPSYCFVGFNRSEYGGDSNYVFVEIRRLLTLPSLFLAPDNAVALYEAGFIYQWRKNKKTAGSRHYFAVLSDGTLTWVKRRVYNSYRSVRGRKGFVSIPIGAHIETDRLTNDNGGDMLPALAITISAYQQREANWYLECSDKRGIVNFSISPGEAKYLFRERLTAKARDGKRKRIIHWVKAHQRVTGQNVKTHLRGERNFQWGGMDVSIALPGLHEKRDAEFGGARLDDAASYLYVPWTYQMAGLTEWYVRRKQKERAKTRPVEVTNPATGEKVEIYAMKEEAWNKAEGTGADFIR